MLDEIRGRFDAQIDQTNYCQNNLMRMTADKEECDRKYGECQTARDRLMEAMRDADMRFNAQVD
jgi:hypothetical protein